jgi:hypothetical protein
MKTIKAKTNRNDVKDFIIAFALNIEVSHLEQTSPPAPLRRRGVACAEVRVLLSSPSERGWG